MNHRVVNGLRFFWVIITLWYELGVFFRSVSSCNWPDAVLKSAYPCAAKTPAHILLVADPQIIDHRSYPERGPFLTYLSRLVVDLNLRKAWWAAVRKQPDVVIFLGDMMDGGRIDMTDDEYEGYYQRFKDIFRLPLGIPTYFIPGNHDIGLRTSPLFSPHARSRYRSHFGPPNSRILVANHTLLLLDAPSFVEEDEQRVVSGHSYQDWIPRFGGPIEFLKTTAQESQNHPIVLLSHIPLARDSFDCGPLREKGTIRPGAALGYQNTLGMEATAFLLETLHPSVVFSGDDHDYCENYHTYRREGAVTEVVREISVKSLSMAMGIKRPGFQLLSLIPPRENLDGDQKTFADVPCFLPDQISIYLSAYIPLLLVSLFIVLGSNALRVHRLQPKRSRRPPHFHPRRIDDASKDHWDEMSMLPQPASTRSPNSGPKRQTSSFVLFGRRRRIMCFELLRRCLTLSCTRRRFDTEGLWAGFLRDARDVAVFPLTLFLAISLWITIT